MALMLDKNFMGYLSLVFVMLTELPYVYVILKGTVKPHVFSRLIWAILVAIAAAAQYSANAGPGAWAMILSVFFFLLIAILSFSHGERNVTRSDWIAFVAGLSAIPLWYFTSDPLAAVILVSLIDAIGYYPTFRKSYYKPKEEMAFSYGAANLKHMASFFAMTEYSATTLLYPTTLFVMNTALVAMLLWRRHIIKSKDPV